MLATIQFRTFYLLPPSKNMKIKMYKTAVLCFVLYGYENWSVMLGEEHRLRDFKNRCCGQYLNQRDEK
jgi:hypothetical protein